MSKCIRVKLFRTFSNSIIKSSHKLGVPIGRPASSLITRLFVISSNVRYATIYRSILLSLYKTSSFVLNTTNSKSFSFRSVVRVSFSFLQICLVIYREQVP
ncbi:hypothetical protein K2173_018119 [Erythroxylum novogranatense]|uniref:Uncharacterized protein n=1 Tax=Erythroxylum novogranatense TaxID=1862640 RepID=A0AAV8U950_9ROSI|nr:hypothetical protein K2173_018119 [Erythroxylum novogranatense]